MALVCTFFCSFSPGNICVGCVKGWGGEGRGGEGDGRGMGGKGGGRKAVLIRGFHSQRELTSYLFSYRNSTGGGSKDIPLSSNGIPVKRSVLPVLKTRTLVAPSNKHSFTQVSSVKYLLCHLILGTGLMFLGS